MQPVLPGTSCPVRRVAPRQPGTRRHRRGIGQIGSIAEGDDPGIVPQQEIQNRRQEIRMPRPGGKIARPRARGRQKAARASSSGDEPGQRLQGQRFGSFPLQCSSLTSSCVGSDSNQKGILNQ